MALCDLKLVYDPVIRRCDYAFNGTDIELDFTPVTPVLIALGCERRARPDDELPDAAGDFYAPSQINPRKGWPGDAFDPKGWQVGSRLWLLQRRKQDEITRRLGETATGEALESFAAEHQLAVSVLVRWVQRNFLGIKVTVANATIDLTQPIAA